MKSVFNTCILPANVLSVFVLLFFFTIRLHAQQQIEATVRNDNDLYLLTLQDQYYTNGVFIETHKPISAGHLKPNELNRNWGITLGHKIYNSFTAQIDSIELVDRPITGHLSLSIHQDRYFKNDSRLLLAADIGIIGKYTFGKELQENLHYLLNMYHASGWEFQLKNAVGANVSGGYSQVLLRANRVFDVSIQAQGTLGLNDIRFHAGPTLRLGRMNPFHRSAHFSARLQPDGKKVESEWYVYYKPETHLVFYDVTLQGGMLLDDKGLVTATPNRWLLSNHFGMVYAANRITFRVRYFFNTKESKQSFFRHQYGSVSLSYRFGTFL